MAAHQANIAQAPATNRSTQIPHPEHRQHQRTSTGCGQPGLSRALGDYLILLPAASSQRSAPWSSVPPYFSCCCTCPTITVRWRCRRPSCQNMAAAAWLSCAKPLTWDQDNEINNTSPLTQPLTSLSTSAIHTRSGSAAPTRTPIECCANTFLKVQTYRCYQPTISITSPPSSTACLAIHSARRIQLYPRRTTLRTRLKHPLLQSTT